MQFLLAMFLMVSFFVQPCVALAAVRDPVAATLFFDGGVRTFRTYTPPGIEKGKLSPLLFVLHGSSGNGEDMMAVTQRGFERIADKEKFLVVYPDAQGRRWNEQGGTVDDAGFLLAIIDKLATESLVDKKRVYMTGISNGGMMAQRMACEHADRVAGIATVAGSLPEAMSALCKPSRPVPVMVIHGSADPIVPWEGGAVAGFEEFGKVLSARGTAGYWAEKNRCRGTAVAVPEPERDPMDGTRVRFEIFSDCAEGADVGFVAIEGGGHTWPGGYQYLSERFIGKTSRDIDANVVIWGFFRRFPN